MAYVPDAPPAYSAQPASPNYGTAPPYASPSYNGDKAGEKAPLLSSPPQTVVTVVPVYNEVRFSELYVFCFVVCFRNVSKALLYIDALIVTTKERLKCSLRMV